MTRNTATILVIRIKTKTNIKIPATVNAAFIGGCGS